METRDLVLWRPSSSWKPELGIKAFCLVPMVMQRVDPPPQPGTMRPCSCPLGGARLRGLRLESRSTAPPCRGGGAQNLYAFADAAAVECRHQVEHATPKCTSIRNLLVTAYGEECAAAGETCPAQRYFLFYVDSVCTERSGFRGASRFRRHEQACTMYRPPLAPSALVARHSCARGGALPSSPRRTGTTRVPRSTTL